MGKRYLGIMVGREVPGHQEGGVPRVYHRVYLGGYTASLLCSYYASLGAPSTHPLILYEQAGYTPRVVGRG